MANVVVNLLVYDKCGYIDDNVANDYVCHFGDKLLVMLCYVVISLRSFLGIFNVSFINLLDT